MNYEFLKIEINEDVMLLGINRADKMNALSSKVLKELESVFIDLRDLYYKNLRGVILYGLGEKAFVAGADIKEMSLMNKEEAIEFSRLGQAVMGLIESSPYPIIAGVHGFALGGGCELAMACDFIYATESSMFGQTEVSLGLIPSFGGCIRLLKYVGRPLAKEMIYTGRKIQAGQAWQMGLVNEVYNSKKSMMDAAKKTLNEIKNQSPEAVSACKKVINNADDSLSLDAFDYEAKTFGEMFLLPNGQEGVMAFLEKRAPQFSNH